MKAYELIREDNWTQGIYHSVDGCHCLVGFLQEKNSMKTGYYRAFIIDLQKVNKVLCDKGYDALPTSKSECYALQFNDTPGRTWSEVRDVLKEANV